MAISATTTSNELLRASVSRRTPSPAIANRAEWHNIPEEISRLAVAHPMVMIASDGIFENGTGHARGAGTYARVLGHYVREQHALSLMEALRKMILMPAQRLGIQSKGQLQVGADADITVFDPDRVIDRATFDNLAQYSEGIPFGGVLVVRDGKLVQGVAPGRCGDDSVN